MWECSKSGIVQQTTQKVVFSTTNSAFLSFNKLGSNRVLSPVSRQKYGYGRATHTEWRGRDTTRVIEKQTRGFVSEIFFVFFSSIRHLSHLSLFNLFNTVPTADYVDKTNCGAFCWCHVPTEDSFFLLLGLSWTWQRGLGTFDPAQFVNSEPKHKIVLLPNLFTTINRR